MTAMEVIFTELALATITTTTITLDIEITSRSAVVSSAMNLINILHNHDWSLGAVCII